MRSRLRLVLAALLLIALAAAGVLYYLHWSSPQQIMARLQAGMEREAERMVEGLPAAIADAAGTERLDPQCPLRRAVHAAGGARAEFDAGPGRVIAVHRHSQFVESNGRDGWQSGEGASSTFGHGPPADLATAERQDWLQSTSGFSTEVPLAQRTSSEFEVEVVDPATGAAEHVRECFGPGIDLSPAAVDWRLLWWRADGVALDWRLLADALLLRCRGLPESAPVPVVALAGGPAREFAADGGTRTVRLARPDLAALAAAGVRCTIRIGTAAAAAADAAALRIDLRPAGRR